MDLLLRPLTEPNTYIYLSGIILIIFGALIGITTPDSRKTLHTGLAIPLFISLGLINIFRSFDFLADVGGFIGINAFLQSFVILCATELGRQNIEKAFSKKKFSAWWYIPLIVVLFLLSYKYDLVKRIIRRILILIAKLFAIIITIKAAKILPNTNRKVIRVAFYFAIIGSFVQFFIDWHFARLDNSHYLPLSKKSIYLFYIESLVALVISILILVRRFVYEKKQKLHVPNTLSLISPMVVFITSIIVALGVLIGSSIIHDTSTKVWLLLIALLVTFIQYLILYGIAYNSENLKTIETAQTNFEHILHHTPDPICVISEDNSTIIAVNVSMQKSFGYEESLIGKKLDDMIVEANHFQYNIPSSNDVVISECKFKKANGETFTAEVTASFIEYASKEAILLNIHDISIFKEIEEKLTEAKNSAEEANQMRSRLLANASHELRTPMMAVMGLTELAVSSCQNEKEKQVLELLRISSKSLMSLINDMFNLTEAQNGKICLKNTQFELQVFLDEIIEYVSFLAKRDNKNISFKLATDIPNVVNADLDHIRHILMTIIIYSFNFYVNNSGIIIIDFKKLNPSSGLLVFTLSGIREEKRKEIQKSIDNSIDYEDSYQASFNRKFASKLSLHYMILSAMNGSVEIEEKVASKESFSLKINIPIEIVENKELSQTTSQKLFYYKGKPLKFLVADDNDVNLFLIESIINRYKGEYYSVKDGLEVLEALKEKEFDVILLDIQMPNLDGMKSLERIRKLEGETSKIPVIAISAFASEDEKNKTLKAGAQMYLGKPFFQKDLYDAVSSVFELDKELPAEANKNEKDSDEKQVNSTIDIKDDYNIDKDKTQLKETLKRIDYDDLKLRISPNSKSIIKLEEIYNRRYRSLDIDIDNCINDNDSEKLREVAHSIKGLVGMMSSKGTWDIARFIEQKAGEGNMQEAINKIGELRIHLEEIAEDLQQIKKYLQ